MRSVKERNLANVAAARIRRNMYVARRFCKRMNLRNVARCFRSWHMFAHRMILVKRMAARNLGRFEHRMFLRWHKFVEMRHEKKTNAATLLQATFRGRSSRLHLITYREKKWAAEFVQRVWRGRNGRILYRHLEKRRLAATRIQARFRGNNGRERYRKLRIEWVRLSYILYLLIALTRVTYKTQITRPSYNAHRISFSLITLIACHSLVSQTNDSNITKTLTPTGTGMLS